MSNSKNKTLRDIHDDFNIIVLPLVSIINISYLLLSYEVLCSLQFYTFLTYMITDSAWLSLYPESANSPTTVLLHHFICIIGWCIPLVEPNFQYFISLALLVEINTFFLTARRRFERSALLEFLFWASWILCRIILYLALVIIFSATCFEYTRKCGHIFNISVLLYSFLLFLTYLNIVWTIKLLQNSFGGNRKHYLWGILVDHQNLDAALILLSMDF